MNNIKDIKVGMIIKLKMLTKENYQNQNDQHLSDQFKVIHIKVIKTKQSVQDPIGSLFWFGKF